MVIMRVFSSLDSVEDILCSLAKQGIVIFSDTKSGIVALYNKLEPIVLQTDILQGYTNHPTEGYVYFIYDSEIYSHAEAVAVVKEFREVPSKSNEKGVL